MEFIKATTSDNDRIMNIIHFAKGNLKRKNIKSLESSFPKIDTLNEDIRDGKCFVLKDNIDISATASIRFYNENNLENEDDKYIINTFPYANIYRIAIDPKYKGFGYSYELIKNIEEYCIKNNVFLLKADIHKEDKVMSHLLKKSNFKKSNNLDTSTNKATYLKKLNI